MERGVDYIGVAAGAVIFNKEGKIFISKRGPKSRNEVGKWDFPGGSIDFWERAEDAAVREVKEEFGMDIEVVKLLEVVDHIIPEEKQHWLSPTFICRHVSGEPRIMEPGKCSEIRWARFEDIPKDELTLSSRSNYEKLKEYLNIT